MKNSRFTIPVQVLSQTEEFVLERSQRVPRQRNCQTESPRSAFSFPLNQRLGPQCARPPRHSILEYVLRVLQLPELRGKPKWCLHSSPHPQPKSSVCTSTRHSIARSLPRLLAISKTTDFDVLSEIVRAYCDATYLQIALCILSLRGDRHHAPRRLTIFWTFSLISSETGHSRSGNCWYQSMVQSKRQLITTTSSERTLQLLQPPPERSDRCAFKRHLHLIHAFFIWMSEESNHSRR